MSTVRDAAARALAVHRKLTKVVAGYKEGLDHCSVCEYYQARSCAIVAGEIDPDDGCRYFVRRVGTADAAQ